MTGPGQPLAVTMGDPAGIGPDITLAAWLRRAELSLPSFVVLGDPHVLAERATMLGLDVPVRTVTSLEASRAMFDRHLPVQAIPCPAPVAPGRPDPSNASAVIAAIEAAVTAVVRGRAGAVVTNPIAKSVLHAAGFRHPGHTELLAELAGRLHGGLGFTPVMMLACDVLRVVPLTIHIPLGEVPRSITGDLVVATLRTMHAALERDFGISAPRIAVAGLNPHAGEGGMIGTEDRDVIAPAIVRARALGLRVSGPHSADTLFHAGARSTYDAVLAMYHDQALIPIKTIAFDVGVNVTLGLPFVRTSPDHGTAFDIAGTGRASPSSLVAALRLASTMIMARGAWRP